MTKPKFLDEPEMLPSEDSELEGIVDISAVGLDHIRRPILFNQDGEEYMEITIADAKRLLEFLTKAIPYLEEQLNMVQQ